jgi:hypothetical protein
VYLLQVAAGQVFLTQLNIDMAIEIGPGIELGPGFIIGYLEPTPVLLIITENGVDLQTESGDDLTTE